MNPHYIYQRRWLEKNPEKAGQICRVSTAKWQTKQRLLSGKQLVTCQICGKELMVIDAKHLKHHSTNIAEYRSQFPGAITHSPDTIREHREHKYANLYAATVLTSRAQSALVGSLLGDGCLELIKNRQSANARYRETAANESYLKWKQSIFAESFEMRFSSGDYQSTQTGKIYHRCRLSSFAHPILREWRERWYPTGKKIVCRQDVESNLDSLALAVWFYDDGNLATSTTDYRAHLYTLSFSFEDVEWLSDLLLSRFSIECSPARCGKTWEIRFPRAGRNSLIEIISGHPAPGMEYKLAPNHPKPPWWTRR